MMQKLKKNAYFYSSYFLSFLFELFFNFLNLLRLEKTNYFFANKLISLFDDNIYLEREEYCPIKKQLVVNVILALPSRGCEYFFKNGGCAMCGFNNEIEKYKFNLIHPRAIDFFIRISIDYFSLVYKKKNVYSILSIFMAGSFLNTNEISSKSQNRIVDYFLDSSFDKLFIESRVEYILKYENNILEYNQRIAKKSKQLEVSLGLESSDEYIRNKIIKKGVSKKGFESSVDFLKKNGILISAYVLVGGPYLSSEEVLHKSIETVQYVWSSGVDVANIEIYCVQDKTPWTELYKKNQFELVNLWIIIQLLKTLNGLGGQWRLGGFSDWPKPLACPHSCDECEEGILGIIKDLRINHNFKPLLELDTCECANTGGK